MDHTTFKATSFDFTVNNSTFKTCFNSCMVRAE
jgi:hypothetical protein